MMRKLLLGLALVSFASIADAQERRQIVTTCGTPPNTYTAGETRPALMNASGEDCVVTSAGGGGAGDASAANQTSQITQETAIAGGVGTTADAAATQGSTGSVNAKLRTLTAQLNTQAGYLDGLEAALAALPQNNVLAAGTANIGDVDVLTLPALVAGTANIGDVDLIAGQTGVDGGGGAIGANTLSVAMASDSPGIITTGTAGTPSSQVLSVQGVASGTALPVSVASIPSHAVTNAGTFPVQTSSAGATAAAVPASANYMAGASDGGLAAGTAATTGMITCGNSFPIAISASGNTELVALTASETIYVCGYMLVASGTVAAQFIYGTGSACATGEADLTGPMDFVANGGAGDASPFYRGMKAAVSNALCLELSAAVAVNGVVYYTKF